MPDQFEEFEEERDEQIRLAELVYKHKEKKLFDQWLQIAYGLDRLEDMAAGQASIEREEEPDYARDRSFQAQMDVVKKKHPLLFELPSAAKRDLEQHLTTPNRNCFRRRGAM